MSVNPAIVTVPSGRGFDEFGQTAAENDKMFQSAAQNDFAPVIALFYGDSAGEGKTLDFLKKFYADASATMPTFSSAVPGMFNIMMLPAPESLWTPISTLLGESITSDIYVQCGFVREKNIVDQSVIVGASLGLTWYDVNCHFTRSVDPKVHPMILFDEEYPGDPNPVLLEQKYRVAIGDIFRDGKAKWCKDLEPIRNEILIKMRAKLFGIKPEFEYNTFCFTGSSQFLEDLS